MDRVWGSNVSQTPPTIPADAPTGYPTDGSVTGGIAATIPKAFWYYMITEELRGLVVAAGLTPSKQSVSQVAAAVQALIDIEVRARAAAISEEVLARVSAISSLRRELNERIDALETFQPGEVVWFARSAAPNSKWIVCDGRAVSRTTYPKLFAAIGTRYGAGNGSTTFNVPNAMGRVAWGSADAGTIEPGLPDVTGRIFTGEHYDYTYGTGAFSRSTTRNNLGWNGGADWDNYAIDFAASKSNPIYGRSDTVQPPAVKLLPCIHI